MSLPLILVLAILATWRLTRLVTLDDFPLIRRPRQRIIDLGWKRNPTSPHAPWYAELAGCPFCASAYLSAALIALLARSYISLPLPAFWWLGVWGGSCLLHALTDGRNG